MTCLIHALGGAHVTAESSGDGTRTTSVLILDDHRAFTDLLAAVLNNEPDLSVCGTATTAAAAVELAGRLRPDLVMVDIQLGDRGGENGLTAARKIRQRLGSVTIVVLSAHSDPHWMSRAASAGADAFAAKSGSLDDLLTVIRRARDDSRPSTQNATGANLGSAGSNLGTAGSRSQSGLLTARERDVLALMAEGLAPVGIARSLAISVHTCRGYVKSIHAKLDVSSQLAAVAKAREIGLLATGD
jgi:DNA-binding NarL/FixJ family response regulator